LQRTKALNKDQRIFGTFIAKINDYGQLVKFKLNLTVVFSAVMAYLIASNGTASWTGVIVLSLGGFLVTAAANALNQVLERDFDKLMKRTANRPIAADRMSVSEAVMAAGLMCLTGTAFLAMFNTWAGLLGMTSMVLYAFVYTPMKRISPSAVAIGAIPGALPLMIGCVAVQGEITTLAIILFAIQFFWQFPHFWAIAWLGDEDYKKAGFNLLPNKTGQLDKNVGWQAMLYALFLVPIGILPYFLGITSIISAFLIAVISIIYAFFGWNLYKKCTREAAMKLMFSSFFYLPIVLFILYFSKV
jgi:protoheme IX farnesyltransferase